MKNVHPQYYTDTKVKCACGSTFTTSSTVKEIDVEICSACHPVYTGVKKIVDTAGRVEKFQQRLQRSAQMKNKNLTASEPSSSLRSK